MSLSEQLKKSRSQHTLKNYDDAVKQLRVFRAVQPITGKKSGYFANTPTNGTSAAQNSQNL